MKIVLSAIAIIAIVLGCFTLLLPKPKEGNVLYVVGWKSELTGYTGQGTKAFPKAIALDIAEKANWRYPDIEHYTVEMKSTPEDILNVRE